MFPASVLLLATWNVTDAIAGKNISTTHISLPDPDAPGAHVKFGTLLLQLADDGSQYSTSSSMGSLIFELHDVMGRRDRVDRLVEHHRDERHPRWILFP
jgi:hypothetical protein